MAEDIQQQIIDCEARVVVVNGCAGSRKTDTAVRLALKRIERKKCVMLLTKVTSVTHETTSRLSQYGGIEFRKSGNHYFDNTVEVANMDAMIHDQLRRLNIDVSGIRGESHKWKCRELLRLLQEENLPDKRIYIKANVPVDVLIVDEFQDFDSLTTTLIFEIAKQNPDMQLVVLGDVMQTLFIISDVHPMNAVKTVFEGDSASFIVSTCWRCPKAHIDFVNALHNDHFKTYGLPRLRSANNDQRNKPIVFSHQGVTHNTGALNVAHCLVRTIKTLLENDDDIHPRDIAIIMRGANRNRVFAQLEPLLNDMYRSIYADQPKVPACKVFQTKGDLSHIAIDWGAAKDHTVMLSVHGDKGKGHKVVFFLGFTEKSVPLQQRIFKDNELLDHSLSYVALTRSLKHLFVGFSYTCPSRYLLQQLQNVKDSRLAVLAWDQATYTSDLHASLCAHLNDTPPPAGISNTTNVKDYMDKSDVYIKAPVFRPDRFVYNVTEIVMDAFEHHVDLVPGWEAICTQQTIVFGKYAPVPRSVATDEIKQCTYGHMGELMFERTYRLQNKELDRMKREFEECFLDHSKVMYTNDEEILCFAADIKLNFMVRTGVSFDEQATTKYFSDIKISDKIKSFIDKLKANKDKPTYVLPMALNTESFRAALQMFFDASIDLESMPTRCIWNMALARGILRSEIRRPVMHYLLDWFHEPVLGLIKNVKGLVNALSRPPPTAPTSQQGPPSPPKPPFQFSTQRELLLIENDPDTLTRMGLSPTTKYVRMGLVGIDDFSSKDCIYEIKCPTSKKDLSTRWVMQALTYMCLGDKYLRNNKYYKFVVIDLTRGYMYKFKFTKELSQASVLRKCLEYMRFDEKHMHEFDNILKAFERKNDAT